MLHVNALDALSTHIVIVDARGTIVSTNLAWRNFALENFGSASSTGVGVDYLRACASAVGEGAAAGATAAQGIRDVIAGALDEFQLEYPCHAPREQRWFQMRATRTPGTGPVHVVIAHANITGRKLAEDQVVLLNGMLQAAGRSARVGGWQWNVSSPRVVWSDQTCDIHEVPPGTSPSVEEAIAFYAPEHRSRIQTAFETCVREGTPFDEELEIVASTQRRVWVRAIGEAVRDGSGAVVRAQGSLQDISDRKHSEVKMRRLAERLTKTLESITDAFITIDGSWQITYVNSEAEHLLGRSRQHLLGKNLRSEVPAFVEGPFQDGYQRAMRELTTVTMEQFCTPLAKWFEVRLYPSDEGVAIYFRDVTGRHQAQVELTQRMDELARSNAELEQFAYVASHDLKEPLRAVASFAQLLEARQRTADPATLREYTLYITQGVQRMGELIDGLLTYARVSQHGRQPEMVPLDAALDAALANLREALNESRAEVSRGALPVVRGHTPLLTQLLQNLTANALKFRGARAPTVTITADRRGNSWLVSVQDNGIGIEPRHAERIFKLFQRLNPREQYPGSGIGLAVCKRIVEAHGGRIWLEPSQTGADFRFTLPAKDH